MKIIKATYYKDGIIRKKKFFIEHKGEKFLRIEKHDFMKDVSHRWLIWRKNPIKKRTRVGKTSENVSMSYVMGYSEINGSIKIYDTTYIDNIFNEEYKKYMFRIREKKFNRILGL